MRRTVGLSPFWILGIALGWGCWGMTASSLAQTQRVYFGTYTQGESRGIYTALLDTATGKVGEIELAAETTSPSFVALHPSGRLLVAVNETVEYQGKPSGFVTSFSIDPESGKLEPINEQASLGGAPCHLVIDDAGRSVLVANYVGGNVVSLPLDPQGRLGAAVSNLQHEGHSVNAARQEGPHAHSVNLAASQQFAIAADLGTDRLYVHGFDPKTGKLTRRPQADTALEPGSGPRHFAFHPDGQHAFVINELSSTLTALRWDAQAGTLTVLQTESTLPEGEFPGNSTAEVVVHPQGRWVYGSNRGHDSLAIFQWDAAHQRLIPRGHQKTLGKTPRNFAIDPSGRWLLAANQSTDNVTVFEIDSDTGGLTEVQQLRVPAPVCVRFLPLAASSE